MKSLIYTLLLSYSCFTAHSQDTKIYSCAVPGESDLHNTLWMIKNNFLYVGKRTDYTWEIIKIEAKLNSKQLKTGSYPIFFQLDTTIYHQTIQGAAWMEKIIKKKFLIHKNDSTYTLTNGNITLNLSSTKEYLYTQYMDSSVQLKNVLDFEPIGPTHKWIEAIEPFSPSGIAVFSSYGNYGLINEKGAIVAEAKYIQIENNSANQPFRFVFKESEKPNSYYYKSYGSEQEGFPLIDYKMNCPMTVKMGYFHPDGTLFSKDFFEKGNPMNEQEIIFAFRNDSIFAFHATGKALPENGWSKVTVYKNFIEGTSPGKTVYYKHDGSLFFSIVFDSSYTVKDEEKEFFFVKKGEKYGVLDDSGNFIYELKYSQILYDNGKFDSKEDGKFIIKENERFWYGDQQGRRSFKESFEEADHFRDIEGQLLAWVKINGKYGVIDTSGKFIIPPIYSNYQPLYSLKEMAVKKDGKWGLTNFKGEIILPFQYDSLHTCDDNFFGYMEKGKWAIAEKKNKKVIFSPRFTYLNYSLSLARDEEGEYYIRDGKISKSGYESQSDWYGEKPNPIEIDCSYYSPAYLEILIMPDDKYIIR